MKLIDCYYFAFKEYRNKTQNNKDLARDRQIYSKSGKELDKFVVKKYLCNINSDWIETIESYIEFVENAVGAERQFIRTDGEVVPIEKVRRVSRDSIVHLAKHSDLITHVDEEKKEDIVPDKLYMTERLSDFAVYENRVLYKLLCYMRDFLDLRLSNIEKLRKSYVCDLYAKKNYESKERNVSLDLVFHDENLNNPYALIDKTQDCLLTRIKDLVQITNMLLNTNLMLEVSKAPLVRDPIVKTNVLKMNNDFKNSLALYEYLVSYTDLGYKPVEVIKEYHPYSDILADELSEVASLLSFLTTKYGNDIEELLQKNYETELKRIEDEEEEKLALKIKRLKKEVLESGKSFEEYMVLLEERNNRLEEDSIKLKKKDKEINELNNKILNLSQTISNQETSITRLNETVKQKDEEINENNIIHQKNMDKLNEDHKLELANLCDTHEKEINNLNEKFVLEKSNLVLETKKLSEEEILNLNNKISDLTKASLMQKNEFGEKEKAFNLELSSAKETLNKTKEELNFKLAELDCERAKNGCLKATREQTQEEKFKELEKNYKLYTKFYKKQWALTKQELRKEILWKKENKKNKDK